MVLEALVVVWGGFVAVWGGFVSVWGGLAAVWGGLVEVWGGLGCFGVVWGVSMDRLESFFIIVIIQNLVN